MLQPSEYDISYFDGKKSSLAHNAGYSSYERWYRMSDDFVPHSQSTGEYWKDWAFKLKLDYTLEGKKVLEIGSAKGFVVEGLRDLGIDAYGLDISQYAYDCAREDIKPYLKVADARTALADYKNLEFDYLFSRRTLACFTNDEMAAMVTQMNRIAVQQVHDYWDVDNPNYYNIMPIQTFISSFSWKKGTIFIRSGKVNTIYCK